MAQEDRDDREMGMREDDLSYIDESAFYDGDTFGERMESYSLIDDDSAMEEELPMDDAKRDRVDQGFGESIDSPHIDDQLGDDTLHQEAAADYTATADGMVEPTGSDGMTDAKDKAHDMTDRDKAS